MLKTIRIMLNPNNKQNTRLFQFAGSARFAYNWALDIEKQQRENGGRFLSDRDLRKMFTKFKNEPGSEWLYTISVNVCKQAIKDAVKAYKRFFDGLAKFPRYKSRKRNRPSFYVDTSMIKFTQTHVKLEHIAASLKHNKLRANWFRLAEHNRMPLNVKYYNPRVCFDGLHWFITASVEESQSKKSCTGEGIGIDLGVKDLAVCSDGRTYRNINKTSRVRRLKKKLRRLQRRISRKYESNKKGEKYQKTRSIIKSEKQLLKVSHRLTNIRTDYVHKVTTEIIKREPSFIVLEDLNVSGMMKNKHLARAVQEQKLAEFYRIMQYKCEWNGTRFITAGRFYPSSKLCSHCGYIKRDLSLSDRVYKCENCGAEIDRDLNAAINLYRYGSREFKPTELHTNVSSRTPQKRKR